jgi:hypothetical protein
MNETSDRRRTLRIVSVRDAASLTLTKLNADAIRAEFISPVFSAVVPEVWLLASQDLVAFFHDLASSWRGWRDAKSWINLEQQLSIVATHDSLGHISLRVRVWENPGGADWVVEGTLQVEAGQLEAVARAAADALGSDGVA